MSNCKPGDVCAVVRTCNIRCMQHFIGVMVKVTIPVFEEGGSIAWQYDGTPKRCKHCQIGRIEEFPDCVLMPIKGDEGEAPGDVLVKNADDATNPFVYVPPVPVKA